MDDLRSLKPLVRLSLFNPDSDSNSMFGRGIGKLCEGVRATGSLNSAAKNMGMAYSKAWRIIRDTEAALGVQLLVREGAHGSSLTEDCERLLAAYQQIEATLQAQAEELFAKALDGK